MIRELVQRVKGLFGVSWGIAGAETWEAARLFDRGLPLSDPKALDKPYAQHAAISTAVSTVAEDAASIGWELYGADDTDKENAIEDHPVLLLFEMPSPGMSGHDLWLASFVTFKLFGECFWYYPDLVLGSKGGFRATASNQGGLHVLDPRFVRVDTTSGAPVWMYRVRGEDMPLDPDKLTQFKRFNPYNQFRGLSELAAVMVEASGDYAAARWNEGFFSKQSGIPAAIFMPPANDGTNADERQDFIKRFNQMHTAKSRRAGLAPPGWTLQLIGAMAKDMDFRALREYSREQILAAIGLPPFRAGVLDKANYANAREQDEVYWFGTITRLMTAFQSKINTDFLPKVNVVDVEFWPCWEKVKALTENVAEKTEIAVKWFGLGLSKRVINERLEMGWPEDEIEDYDVGYLPFSVVPASLLGLPRTPAGPANETDQTNDGDDDAPDDEQMRSAPAFREQRRTLVWKNLIARTRDLEIKFDRTIRRHMRELQDEALEFVSGLKGWLASHTKAEGLDIIDTEEAKRRLQKATEPIHRTAMVRGGESLLSDLGLGVAFDLDDPFAIAKITELTHKITRIDDTVEAALRESLSEGISLGESPQDLARRVRQVMDVSTARSMTIARTETGFAFNTGRNVAMRQQGIEKHEWLTARDGKVRDSHISLDGEVRAVGENFRNGLAYPLDPSGPPSEIINCRCVALPVVE